MVKKRSHALIGLRKIAELLDYEILVSRTGVSDPDSDFIWAPTFMAPESIAVVDGQMFLNLFLPEGAEKDHEKMVFLNRVGARLQDGLWQVRRRMDQLVGKYGGGLQVMLSLFRTLVIDQMYIKDGRNYSHLLINHSDFELFSRIIIQSKNERPDLKIEYFRKIDPEQYSYNIPGLDDDLSFITIEFGPEKSAGVTAVGNEDFFFVMANFVESGVKAVALSKSGNIPNLLQPTEISSPAENVHTFRANNKFIHSLVGALANEYVVVYGYFGFIDHERAALSIALPKEQVSTLIRILSKVSLEVPELYPLITEVVSIGDFSE